jgi:hypothetical protein
MSSLLATGPPPFVKIWSEEEEIRCVHDWWVLLEVRGIFNKSQQLNQRGFHSVHSSFVKATFPKATARGSFF